MRFSTTRSILEAILKPCLPYYYTRPFTISNRVRDLREFLDVEALKGKSPVVGKEWTAALLRMKSWTDLHKLWYVLLKERLMLKSEFLRYKSVGEKMQNPERYRYVRKSMCRIKQVLTERALKETDQVRREEMKRRINAL
eukprot:g6370.t1